MYIFYPFKRCQGAEKLSSNIFPNGGSPKNKNQTGILSNNSPPRTTLPSASDQSCIHDASRTESTGGRIPDTRTGVHVEMF